MKKFWFFDLDGTLADTDGDIRESWKAALRDLGISCPHFDRDFVAGPPIEASAKMLLGESYTDATGAAIRERFGFHYDTDGFPNTFEYPGVLDRVRELKRGGARVFIVTNKRFAGASAMAKKFGWHAVFDKIYAGDMFKDDPAIGRMDKTSLIAFVMRENGASAEDCAMVGDTLNDFAAARANQVRSIAVSWGYGSKEELLEADKIAYVPADIADETETGK